MEMVKRYGIHYILLYRNILWEEWSGVLCLVLQNTIFIAFQLVGSHTDEDVAAERRKKAMDPKHRLVFEAIENGE